jgi:[acyl-carrier-protein] S-malonyltransferase
MTLVFLFPGQNSRYPGMITKLATLDPDNAQLVEFASAVLGRDLRAHFRADNPLQFERNRDVQVGVFLANEMMRATLERAGLDAPFSAGLDVGEYNHLVHIGALAFEDGLRLLEARGDAYDAGPHGAMYAVAPVEPGEVEEAIVDSASVAEVGIGVHNSPRECVLSGTVPAIQAVLARLESDAFVEPTLVDAWRPMHSPLYDTVARRFRPDLDGVSWRKPRKPYLPNVLGRFEPDPGPRRLRDLLALHVWRPVFWRQSVDCLDAQVRDPVFVEVGPKRVLHDLIGRRWLARKRFATDSAEGFRGHLASVVQDLRHAAGRVVVAH